MKKVKQTKSADNLSEIKKEIRDQFTVVLEKIKDEIQIVAEGQMDLSKKFDDLKNEFDNLEDNFNSFQLETKTNFRLVFGRLDKLENKFNVFESSTDKNFKKIFEYLSRIDDEIQDIKKRLDELEKNRAGEKSKDYTSLRNRVLNLENELAEMKVALKLKTA